MTAPHTCQPLSSCCCLRAPGCPKSSDCNGITLTLNVARRACQNPKQAQRRFICHRQPWRCWQRSTGWKEIPTSFLGQKPGTALVNLEKPWRAIRKVAVLPNVRLHDLRHAFASIGAAGGDSLLV